MSGSQWESPQETPSGPRKCWANEQVLQAADRTATCSFVIIRVAGSQSMLALASAVQTLSVSFFSLTKLAGTRFVLGTKEREISRFLPRRSGLSEVKVVGSETVPRRRTCG